ncbi:MAG: pyridoxamine 5'-phosphate oxidase family protein [Treponema sp.]|nr:pyridoxamine 5'-phosphate oxidase family protein [Treponema sp.]MCL2273016.1 pyridoxamine 5'-phosphate oxidase family protein [Treponema sp.]
MRRQDREITDINEKINILDKCKVCRIGLSENNMPYVIPLNYGYVFENNLLTLYFHSALKGKKLEIIKANDNACFEVDCDLNLIEGENACDYGYAFKSIIGFGKISIIEDTGEKIFGLNTLMKHQTEKEKRYDFPEEQLKSVCVFKMAVDEFSGKSK